MKRMAIWLPMALAACAPGAPGETAAPITIEESTRHCQTRACSQTPTVIVVFGAPARTREVQPIAYMPAAQIKGFSFIGWARYDGRLDRPGDRYLAFLDARQKKFCEGLYHWDGVSQTNHIAVKCFNSETLVTGFIRSAGRQTRGRFAGKAVGIGMMKFDGGLMAVIYGVTLEELAAPDFSFKRLWLKYGGGAEDFPDLIPHRRDRAPEFKRVAVAPGGEEM